MTPKRGDRAAPPPAPGEWALRFDDSQAANGWEQLCKQAPGNTLRAWEELTACPCPAHHTGRHQPLKGALGAVRHRGVERVRWQYEVTGVGRIWYVVDPDVRVVWLTLCETGHPKATD